METGAETALKLARRMGRIGESATIRVSRLARERRERGLPVLDLSAGEPDFPSPVAATEAARRALADGLTRYTSTAGPADLRRALASDYRHRWDAPWSEEEVLLTVGGKGALFQLALALFEDGDRVVVPSPAWVSFEQQIRLAGAEPVLVPMAAERGFELDSEAILAAVDADVGRTRAVILNSPCNPTGAVIAPDRLERLVAGCAERGVLLISDETYERFVWEGEPTSAAGLASSHPETVVVVSSFSKSWAMTGWRLGWVLGPPPLLRALCALQSHAVTHPTTFVMAGALAALEQGEEELREHCREYRARRDLVAARLGGMPGVRCLPPAGTFYAFPDLSGCLGAECPDSTVLAERLLEREGVAVVPGAAFGSDRHLRLSFAASRECLEEGLDRMARVCAELQPAGETTGSGGPE